jgi:hypothetical protein
VSLGYADMLTVGAIGPNGLLAKNYLAAVLAGVFPNCPDIPMLRRGLDGLANELRCH